MAPTVTHPAEDSAVLRQLTVSILPQTEEAESANALQKEELERKWEQDNTKKDRMKKIHPLVKNMILVASAMDEDVVPTELVPSCHAYNCEIAVLANQELSQQSGALVIHEVTGHIRPWSSKRANIWSSPLFRWRISK